MRLIARLDIKSEKLVKTIGFEGLRKLGSPDIFAKTYYNHGVHELLYLDLVASLYSRPFDINLLSEVSKSVFIPISAGGGIKSVGEATLILRNGADKVCLNSQAVRNPDLISDLSEEFGSQAVIGTIYCKRFGDDFEVLIDAARERTGLNPFIWAKQLEARGAGELMFLSVDRDGTNKGLDKELAKRARESTSLPLILSGGFNGPEDYEFALATGVDAIASADYLHFSRGDLATLATEMGG